MGVREIGGCGSEIDWRVWEQGRWEGVGAGGGYDSVEAGEMGV